MTRPPADAAAPLISIDDFAKVQLRTGRILEAMRHPDADKQLVFKVDVGEPEPRTIVAGIASRTSPSSWSASRSSSSSTSSPGVSEPLPPGTIVR